MTTFQQLSFVKKGLKLKDVFVLFHLQNLTKPITLATFLRYNPLLDMSDKSLRNSINTLEEKNLLTKFKTSSALVFIFPFLCSVKKGKRFKPKYRKFLSVMFGKNKLSSLYKYNYILSRSHNENIMNIKSHNEILMTNKIKKSKCIDDDIMYKGSNSKHSLVVNKNNFNYLNDIKMRFKKEFPNKNNYISNSLPENFHFELLIEKIKESSFLSSKDNLNFTWMINHYDQIINDQFKPFRVKTEDQGIVTKKHDSSQMSQREYTKEDLNYLFDDLSDIPLPENYQ